MAIGLGFDAVNSEYNRRTLSRILAQPIYRDALLFGKFLAGLFTITISLVALWLLVVGLGLVLLGVPPSLEEIARAFILLLVTIAYAGVWLALAILFSIVFRSAATAALVTFGIWLFLTFLWPSVLSQMLAAVIAPPDPGYTALGLPTPETVEWGQLLSRLSPSTLFGEMAFVLLNPDDVSARALGTIYLVQLQGAVRGALPLGQSLLIAWPDIVGLVAGTISYSPSATWCSSARKCAPKPTSTGDLPPAFAGKRRDGMDMLCNHLPIDHLGVCGTGIRHISDAYRDGASNNDAQNETHTKSPVQPRQKPGLGLGGEVGASVFCRQHPKAGVFSGL